MTQSQTAVHYNNPIYPMIGADLVPIQAGVFEIDWDTYRSIKALNISSIPEMKRTPLHFQAAISKPSEATWQMNVGTAFHYLALEPERFQSEIVEAPPFSKNSNKYKEWALENEGKIILSADQIANVYQMVRNMKKKAIVRDLLASGWAERSVLWRDPDFGFWCKGRVDFLPEHKQCTIVDLKKTVDAGRWKFQRSIESYRYYWQAHWYLTGVTVATGVSHRDFYWIAWEDTDPWDGNVFKADPREVSRAADSVYALKKQYARCLESGEWPGYDDEIIDLSGRSLIFDEPNYNNLDESWI